MIVFRRNADEVTREATISASASASKLSLTPHRLVDGVARRFSCRNPMS
jgi:hypothetical protein